MSHMTGPFFLIVALGVVECAIMLYSAFRDSRPIRMNRLPSGWQRIDGVIVQKFSKGQWKVVDDE